MGRYGQEEHKTQLEIFRLGEEKSANGSHYFLGERRALCRNEMTSLHLYRHRNYHTRNLLKYIIIRI